MEDHLDPPYPLILERLRQGVVIPLLGSGASLGDRLSAEPWKKEIGSPLPTAGELARYLADKTKFPSEEPIDLAKVAQYFCVVGGRESLEQELHSIFNYDYSPLQIHHFLATITAPLIIVTTNYDELIENAYKEKGQVYDVVIHTTDPSVGDNLLWWKYGEYEPWEVSPNKLDIDLESTTVIYKVHGAVDRGDPKRDQYVITEDDYIDFMARMTKNKAIPAIFAEPFQKRPFLFLGYSLRDWNLRVVLSRIEKDLRRSKGIKSWSIQAKPSLLEKRFWSERGVDIFDMSIEDFVKTLSEQ